MSIALPTSHLHPALNADDWALLRWQTHNYYIDANHWLHGPNVVHAPIPEAGTQPVIAPALSIVHTNANAGKITYKQATANWGSSINVGEAHFQVDGVDGEANAIMAQAMPLNRRADCNYKANRWWDADAGRYRGAISFECQDRGGATVNTTPLSVAQLGHLIGAMSCICAVYGAWCTTPGAWNDSGIGHHILYPEWYATPRSCPGAARIRQMDYIRAEVAGVLGRFSDATGGRWRCGAAGTP